MLIVYCIVKLNNKISFMLFKIWKKVWGRFVVEILNKILNLFENRFDF